MEEGAFLDETVDACFLRHRVAGNMKGLVYQIASGVIRQKGYLDWLLSLLVERDVRKDVRHLLWISLYQVAFMKKAHYHVVMEAVEFAKRLWGARIANFVNAVLRRFIRERERLSLPADPAQRLSVAYSFPQWIVRRWSRRFGTEEAERLFFLLNEPPRFTIRINAARMSKEDVVRDLAAEGIGATEGRLLSSALHVDRLGPLLRLPLFKDGSITIQDETSQLVAGALAPMEGERVLDACAGLGTKTMQLMETAPGASITAMDRDTGRLRLLGAGALRVRADALASPFRNETFDAILLDAPCSSMGIIRKHPEIKWRRNEEDITAFGDLQLDLLRRLWDNLRTGGRMVYSVCSFEPEETVEVVEKFRRETACAEEDALPALPNHEKGPFLSVPHETGMDGFFIARLRKP